MTSPASNDKICYSKTWVERFQKSETAKSLKLISSEVVNILNAPSNDEFDAPAKNEMMNQLTSLDIKSQLLPKGGLGFRNFFILPIGIFWNHFCLSR